jgi:uncharacterized circularly permuted ATP-grasp superfamily protein/uncharacterized alpha-E superfamily protein
MAATLLPGYPRPRGRYDEMCAADGQARPHWRLLAQALAATSPAQWRERDDAAQQRIRENGVTYNVYADPKGADRPWALDIVPLLLDAGEWAGIAAAVAQRAVLLDRVLADLYGEQQLLHDKSIPPALVFGHNGYLWPCRGIAPPGARFLHLYAADLARSPDGRWWVIADRTQAPSGAGYALENRQIISRLYPALYRDLHVQHLTNFFRALQQSLIRHAPVEAGEAPTVVLLTPGPLNETYFEHVYLARQLGFTLAEGQDLTVRGETLYLKTVAGLQRVHALLRRLDDDWCDPLDLRIESTLGVPGLVDVARAGRVLIANALGSGVLESPGLSGFLPGLCERLLGEKLRMPAVATWWCGEAAACEYVVEHLHELVLKPAYPSQRMEPVFGNRLGDDERAQWIARIRARPNAYVAQEIVQLSQAPAIATDLATGARFNGDAPQLQPRTIGLRVYAVATEDGYTVLPGGLARVAGDTSIDVLSMQRGGSSKDIWVPAAAKATGGAAAHAVTPAVTSAVATAVLPPTARLGARDLVRTQATLSSRAAENLFWLGRYGERVDCNARLLRVAMLKLLDDGDSDAPRLLLALCERAGLLPPGVSRSDTRLLAAVFDEGNAGSLGNDIQRTLRAAMHARERLATAHWQAIERLQDASRRARLAKSKPRLDLALQLLDRVLLAGTTLQGHVLDDMVRDAGWRLLVIGRRLERIQRLAAVVQGVLLAGAADLTRLDADTIEALLEIADSSDAWRLRYLRAPELLPALDIVVFAGDNPHALLFQAAKLLRDLCKLRAACGSNDADIAGLDALQHAVAALRAFTLAQCDPALATPPALADAQRELAARIGALSAASAVVSDQLGYRYFMHIAEDSARVLAV